MHGHESLITLMLNKADIVISIAREQKLATDETFVLCVLLARPYKPLAEFRVLAGFDRWEMNDIY